MRFILGGYSQIGFGSPASVFERVLDQILKPILTLLYHREDSVFSLCLSGAEIEWFDVNHPEVNMLIADLVKKGRINLVGSTYYQGILSLLPSKERGAQIERSTTELRRRYGQRTNTLFCYSQVFSPYYLSTLSLCDIESLIISPCSGSCSIDEKIPFIMQELDKSIKIFPIDKTIGLLTSRLSSAEISFNSYYREIEGIVTKGNQDTMVAFLNLDQICTMDIPNEQIAQFFSMLLSQKSIGTNEYDLPVGKGYQCDGWYGYDCNHFGLTCFNSLFINDQSSSYLYNRFSTFIEIAKTYKKNKDVKKQLEKLLTKCGMGNPYVMDSNASMLRVPVRQLFYRLLYEAQVLLCSQKDFSFPSVYDYDRDGFDEYLYMGKNLSSVLSPVGGSLSELIHLPTLTNFGGAFTPMKGCGTTTAIHNATNGKLLRIFSDVLMDSGSPLSDFSLSSKNIENLAETQYTVFSRNSIHGEFITKVDASLNISKQYKFRQNTVLVEVTLSNTGKETVKKQYGMCVPLSVIPQKDSLSFNITDWSTKKTKPYNEREVIVEDVRSARILGPTTLTLFGDCAFTLLKEDYTIQAKTVMGVQENFFEHVLLFPVWPVSLLSMESVTLTIGLRIEKK
ncbi:MAG: DUF1926 domain-containing protein [Sphaerochaetaceae bacterium]